MVGRSAERTPRRAWRWRLSSSSRWRCSCRPRPRGDGARLLALFLGDHLVDEAVGLLEVLDPVLRVVAAGVLDDAALAEVEAVGLDELDGLDLEAGVVVRRDGVVFAHGATGKIKSASRRVPLGIDPAQRMSLGEDTCSEGEAGSASDCSAIFRHWVAVSSRASR